MHPHIAEISSPPPAGAHRGAGSPLFNWRADQTWNNGEGFPAGTFAPDHGGYRDGDHANVQVGDIHPYRDAQGNGGWVPLTATTWHFVGYLRPTALANGAQVDDAAFEVIAPLQRDHAKPLVVIIGLWPTWGTPTPPGQEVDHGVYPGHLRPDGLVAGDPVHPMNAIARPDNGVWLVENALNAATAPGQYQAVFAHIVPRTFGRPMTFEMQRAIQLAKAIDLMLVQPVGSVLLPPGFDPSHPTHRSPPKLAEGGSFGGLTAQVCALFHPDVFHGSFAGTFSDSCRRLMGEQFTYRYLGRGTGMTLHDTSYNLKDALEWPFYLRQIDADYFNVSLLVRQRFGEVRRPMAWLVADEDTVTSGVDWIPYLSGTRGIDYQGLIAGPPLLAWSVVDRRCHGEGGPVTTPILGLPVPATVHGILEMLPYVYMSWQASPTTPPPTFAPDDGSEAPYDHALARGPYVPPAPNPYLELDPAFGTGGRTPGQGLALGIEESLRSYLLPEDTEESLYSGSFDGVVTRYVRNPVTDELDVAAQSPSLGYGAWALDVGRLGTGYANPVAVVGTLRAIHVLDAETLQPLPVGPYALDFEHEAPRRLQLAQVHATGADNDIVFTTFHGHLMVLRADLTLLTDLGEPGIEDFAIHDASYGTADTTSKRPITILSHRQHIVNLTVSDMTVAVTEPLAQIHCWTDRQVGTPYDLELFDDNGTTKIAVSYGTKFVNQNPVIRVFDALTLAAASPQYTSTIFNGEATDIVDIECVHDSQGAPAGFAVLKKDFLWWVPFSGGAESGAILGSFAPATRPVALRAVDLGPGVSGYREELALSTMSGHVVWLTVQDILDAQIQRGVLQLLRPTTAGSYSQAFPRTNRSLAGTWGMVSRMALYEQDLMLPRLYAATQAGELYEVDPMNGSYSWLADMRGVFEAVGFPASYNVTTASPMRDLIVLGAGISTSQSHPDRIRRTNPTSTGTEWWLETRPWRNYFQQPYSPLWYKHPLDPQVSGLPEVTFPPKLPVYFGFSPFAGSGAASGLGTGDPPGGGDVIRYAHWWGGQEDTYPNLVQGAWVDPLNVLDTWYSTHDGAPPYDTTDTKCKDLRNNVSQVFGSVYNLQSLRIGEDEGGTVLVLNTPGSSVTLVRPPTFDPNGNTPGQHMGVVLWDGSTPSTDPDLDAGCGGMALATRQAPDDPLQIDIFAGACLTYPDPNALPPGNPAADIVGSVRWLRWDGTTMLKLGTKILTAPTLNDRAGFAVSGIAVGDLLQSPGCPGDELVVTTLSGELYVFELGAMAIGQEILHTWLPGSLGAYNSIVIDDLDQNGKNEMYIAGSQGIWKWRQR
ncbi:MAG: hypothetical protein IPM29_15775 [Planctomycetes bacterium]|nr:hypothetical protein [Planctomycetota bacterium]